MFYMYNKERGLKESGGTFAYFGKGVCGFGDYGILFQFDMEEVDNENVYEFCNGYKFIENQELRALLWQTNSTPSNNAEFEEEVYKSQNSISPRFMELFEEILKRDTKHFTILFRDEIDIIRFIHLYYFGFDDMELVKNGVLEGQTVKKIAKSLLYWSRTFIKGLCSCNDIYTASMRAQRMSRANFNYAEKTIEMDNSVKNLHSYMGDYKSFLLQNTPPDYFVRFNKENTIMEHLDLMDIFIRLYADLLHIPLLDLLAEHYFNTDPEQDPFHECATPSAESVVEAHYNSFIHYWQKELDFKEDCYCEGEVNKNPTEHLTWFFYFTNCLVKDLCDKKGIGWEIKAHPYYDEFFTRGTLKLTSDFLFFTEKEKMLPIMEYAICCFFIIARYHHINHIYLNRKYDEDEVAYPQIECKINRNNVKQIYFNKSEFMKNWSRCIELSFAESFDSHGYYSDSDLRVLPYTKKGDKPYLKFIGNVTTNNLLAKRILGVTGNTEWGAYFDRSKFFKPIFFERELIRTMIFFEEDYYFIKRMHEANANGYSYNEMEGTAMHNVLISF